MLRGQPKVHEEMSLTVLAYNIKRVIGILGVAAMIAAVAASSSGTVNTNIMLLSLLATMIMIMWWWTRATDQQFSHRLRVQHDRLRRARSLLFSAISCGAPRRRLMRRPFGGKLIDGQGGFRWQRSLFLQT